MKIQIANKHPKAYLALALLALLTLPLAARADQGAQRTNPFLNNVTTAQATTSDAGAVSQANELSKAFRSASNQVLPTLVAIETRLNSASGSRSRPNPFFQEPAKESSVGIGSGVVVDPSGIILTNNHVVMGGKGQVTVRLNDGREFPAVEVLTDPKTDIAIVRINSPTALHAAPMGDSNAAEIGDWVLALGQPFGLDSTVTAGIISAKQRGIGMSERESYIQTDAAINPGNSGGPLVNLKGEVVGINTAISSRSGGNEGIGFAVPINLAKWVGGQLVEHGSVHRAYLGVGVQELNATLAQQFGVQPKGGVAVTLIQRQSPAESAKLQVGDVIVSLNGESIHTPSQLQLAVERSEPGKHQQLTIIRNGKLTDVSVVPAQQDDDSTARPSRTPQLQGDLDSKTSLGMQVETLGPEIATRIGLEDTEGVVVTAIARGGAAQKSGLSPGDVITEVNQQPIQNLDQFAAAMEDVDANSGILLLVKSKDGSRFLVLKYHA